MKKYRLAVVGVGQIAYQVAAALAHHPQVALYAVCSRALDKARHFAQTFAIARPTAEFDEILADALVDIVYIATPNHTHRDLCLRAIQAKKHVLCEKPLGISANEVQDVVRAQASSGCIVMEALWTRFLPLFAKIRELLRDQAIGPVIAYEAALGHRIPFLAASRFYRPGLGGGALLDLGVYPLSLAQWLFGDATRIASTTHAAPTLVEDEALLVLQHERDISGEIKVSFRRELRNDLVLYGQNGRLEIAAPLYRPPRWRLIAYREPAPAFTPGTPLRLAERLRLHQGLFALRGQLAELQHRLRPSGWQRVAYRGNGYGHQADALVSAIDRGQTMVETMPLADSLKVLQLIDRCKA